MFVNNVCSYREANRQMAHEGGLDLRLLELINDDMLNVDLVKAALAIVVTIASVVSSLPAVAHFISLFCPVDGRFLSPVIVPALDSINQIVVPEHE
jgi:hypothetical protein